MLHVSSMYKPTQAFTLIAEKFNIFTHHIVSEVLTKAWYNQYVKLLEEHNNYIKIKTKKSTHKKNIKEIVCFTLHLAFAKAKSRESWIVPSVFGLRSH